jgi:hypothetical protein
MARTLVTATIPSGQSLSNGIDLSAGTAIFVHMPGSWTPALLSFQISADNVTYGDLVDTAAKEVSINITPGTVVKANWIPALAGWLKIRSGSRSMPVVQSISRAFVVSVDA